MNFFGLGLEEIVFILLLVIIIFAPSDIRRAGKTIGQTLNRLARSETWRLIHQTGEVLRALPGRLMKEAGLDELQAPLERERSEIQDLVSGNSLSKDDSVSGFEGRKALDEGGED